LKTNASIVIAQVHQNSWLTKIIASAKGTSLTKQKNKVKAGTRVMQFILQT